MTRRKTDKKCWLPMVSILAKRVDRIHKNLVFFRNVHGQTVCLLSQATTGIRNFRDEGQRTGRNFKIRNF